MRSLCCSILYSLILSSFKSYLALSFKKSLIAEWLEQVSQGHELYCHDLEAMSLNPGRVELGVHSTSV